MAKTEINERDAKLIQWLNEAYAKEAELEMDLAAHITLTEKTAYKKRLQAHLKETREHKRAVASPDQGAGRRARCPVNPAGPADRPGRGHGQGRRCGQGPGRCRPGAGDRQAETQLRNAQEELREEHVEIAIYQRLETFGEAVGDRETEQLARRIRREEERMAKYLTTELSRLTKDVVRSQVPREQRTTPGSRRQRRSPRTRAATA